MININNFPLSFQNFLRKKSAETAMEITDRNCDIFSTLIHNIREDDTILFSPSEIRILFGILIEDFVHLQNDLTLIS